MKIYTKTGDKGETSLFAGGRVSKDHARLHAYGTLDELNSFLGLALALGLHPELTERVQRVQAELFEVGADLATPLDANQSHVKRVGSQLATQLETEIDEMSNELEPLTHFILPSGTTPAAVIHVARTVCRRAERWMAAIKSDINPATLIYVNRLSDWLFTLARLENARSDFQETIWNPST